MKMHTSRAALNRLLDENDASLTLTKLAGAAAALGRRIKLELSPIRRSRQLSDSGILKGDTQENRKNTGSIPVMRNVGFQSAERFAPCADGARAKRSQHNAIDGYAFQGV